MKLKEYVLIIAPINNAIIIEQQDVNNLNKIFARYFILSHTNTY